MSKWGDFVKHKGVLFLFLTFIAALVVFVYYYFYGPPARVSKETLLVPKLIIFIIVLFPVMYKIILSLRSGHHARTARSRNNSTNFN